MGNKLESINIVDRLSIRQFRADYKEYSDYEVKAALFLTYSVDPKVILGLLQSLFFEREGEAVERKKTKEEVVAMIAEILKNIYGENPKDEGLRGKFAVFYNNGNKPLEENISVADATAMKFAYPVTVGKASFHPKVYIVKYGPKEDGKGDNIYRFIIGSHNLSKSGNMEHAYSFDRKEVQLDENTSWDWLDSLLNDVSICDYKGEEVTLSDCKSKTSSSLECNYPLQVLEEIKKCALNLPEILVKDFGEIAEMETLEESVIFSPFLSGHKLETCKASVFTTHFELTKRGFFQWDEADEEEKAKEENKKNKRLFYVFSPQEGSAEADYAIPHYKIYVSSEGDSYTGSLNYTDSAFLLNKEVLVKLPFALDISGMKKWYEARYYYRKEREGDPKVKIEDYFKNLIRKKLLGAKLKLTEQNNTYTLKLSFENAEVEKIKGKLEEEYPERKNLAIIVRPEYIFIRKKLSKDLIWEIANVEKHGLRSSLICFELWEEDKLLTTYGRSFLLEEGVQILAETIEEEEIDAFLCNSFGNDISEQGKDGTGPGSRTVGQIREQLKLFTLEELLRIEPKLRQKKIKVMEKKLTLLNYRMAKLKNKEEQDRFLTRIGCAAGDRLICRELINQANQICQQLNQNE